MSEGLSEEAIRRVALDVLRETPGTLQALVYGCAGYHHLVLREPGRGWRVDLSFSPDSTCALVRERVHKTIAAHFSRIGEAPQGPPSPFARTVRVPVLPVIPRLSALGATGNSPETPLPFSLAKQAS